jgi:low affinity Fe/Cu permease
MRPGKPSSFFNRFAKWTARAAGKLLAFFLAVIIVVVWATTGPILGFGTTWQLVINTVTTIVTFLTVFLMQNTQFRDSEAIQIKLDELICVIEGAHNILLDLEELAENDLSRIRGEYQKLAEKARKDRKKGKVDTGVLEVRNQRKA